MSRMKEFAEQVSEEMGQEGELTPEVLAEAQRRIDARSAELDPDWCPPEVQATFLTEAIEQAASLLQCNFVTLVKQQRGRVYDFHPGQMGMVTCDRSGKATVSIQQFRYLSENRWLRIE